MKAHRALALPGLATALVLVTGCGPAPHTRAAGALTPLAVRRVQWNPAGVNVGAVRAVADAGNVVAVFGDTGATVLSSGAAVATDTNVTGWVSARTIAGADGSARWIVGVNGQGHLYYLRGLSAFDDVSARYGLDGRKLLGATMLDASHVGFLLEGEIAVADGRRVTRYATGALLDLEGGGGIGAGLTKDSIVSFDATSLKARSYPLPDVTRVAVGVDGRLYATTPRAVYASGPDGNLSLVYSADADTVHGLAASGAHVWFADGRELGVVDGDHVAETTGAGLSPDAVLAPSATGDVWVLAGGKLQRFTRVDPEPALALAWNSTLSPIFAKVCSSCHQPNGSSGTDLSTPEDWESERQAIRDRVVVSRSMPPEGHPLSDDDRRAIESWVNGTASATR